MSQPSTRQVQRHWSAAQQAEKRRDWAAAAPLYEAAAKLAPQDALYSLKAGTCHLRLARPECAEAAARKVLARQPQQPLGLRLLAESLAAQSRPGEAAEALTQALNHTDRTPDLLLQLAQYQLAAQQHTETVMTCMEVVQKTPTAAQAYLTMGSAFLRLRRPKDASLCLETAIATSTDEQIRLEALSLLVHELRQGAEWAALQERTQALFAALDRADDACAAQISAFALMALPSSPAQQRRVASLQLNRVLPQIEPLPPRSVRRPGPLRVGYLSNDFYQHATSHLMAGLLEAHDRRQIEVHLYCHSQEDHSPLQTRIRQATDAFHDVRELSVLATAQAMRRDDIDIAIDLKGYTEGHRMHALAYRPAPIQVSFLGYPGTTGVDFLDYVIGDPTVTPLAHAADFSEHIAQLPHSYQPNDERRALPVAPSRSDYGLPEDRVVLCSFNQTYKVSPEMADLWAEILRQAPQAVLWQLIWDERAAGNLARELQARGVDPERLYFSPRVASAENLARLGCADLMLDTWPYNAHTTSADALWMGVPVLTVPGATFASRVASSLVQACGLPELSCPDAATYVERAVTLVNHPAELQRLQHHLREQRHSLPLFDTVRYARDFDRLLLRMWARHEQGLPPAALPAQASEPLTR